MDLRSIKLIVNPVKNTFEMFPEYNECAIISESFDLNLGISVPLTYK